VKFEGGRDTAPLAAPDEPPRDRPGSFPGIVWLTDRDLRITGLYGADLERLGVRAEDIVGRTVREFFGVEDDELPVVAAHLRALAGETASYEQEVERQPRRGWIEPVMSGDGLCIGTVGVSVSAIEPNQMARESEALTRAVLQAALDAVVIINSAGRVIEFNPAAEAIFGFERADVIGREMVDLIIPPSLRDAHRAGFERYLRTGESKILGSRLELSAVRADGSQFPAELTITRVRFGREPVFAGYIRDVTEQHVLEEQLRQSQKMEAIGSLAGGIAHDFNNILMVIRSSSALALRGEARDEDVRRHIGQIDRAAERAASLTRQLLAFSRQQILRPEVTDLNDVVRDTLGMVERLIGENIKTAARLADEVAPIVVDRGQLVQVLINLAVNARDAMPSGGTLDLRTANAVLDASYAAEHPDVTPGAYVLLQLTDSGLGMDEETRARIFDPFFTTKDEGTGLGLATVYGVVRQSSGHIWVYSEPGYGTTFKLYFPVSGVQAAVSDEPKAVPAPGTETILLAEDEEQVRELIAKTLRLEGYTVLEARNGIEAIGLAHEHGKIDLLLTDVVMPGLNGRELWERLSSERPGLRALFTSGYPADTVLRHGIAEGRVAYIEKPYLPSELTLKIREVLDAS
jgi:hypothetical protein